MIHPFRHGHCWQLVIIFNVGIAKSTGLVAPRIGHHIRTIDSSPVDGIGDVLSGLTTFRVFTPKAIARDPSHTDAIVLSCDDTCRLDQNHRRTVAGA